ncbi:MAG: hypothetical protein JKY43_02810 [Phycisphaerales bacterium]|nr:hypothetical protein [Phycisphaerales bacterium]
MGNAARITDIKALADLRPALIRFGEHCQSALTSDRSDALKVLSWLQQDRLSHWKREIRVRSELAVRANTKLVQQTAGDTPRPSVDARKEYELAKRRVREAEEKHELTRRWIRVIEKEIDQYRGSIQPMAEIAQSCMTKGLARIDSLISAIDAYISSGAPEQAGRSQGEDPGLDSDAEGSLNLPEEESS